MQFGSPLGCATRSRLPDRNADGSLRRWLRIRLRAASWIIRGTLLASMSGEWLLSMRVPGSHWRGPLLAVMFVVGCLELVEGFPTMPSRGRESNEDAPWLLTA